MLSLRSGCGYKTQHESPCRDGNILSFDCFSVNILVILYCNSVKMLPSGELGKGYVELLCYFLQLHGNLQLS